MFSLISHQLIHPISPFDPIEREKKLTILDMPSKSASQTSKLAISTSQSKTRFKRPQSPEILQRRFKVKLSRKRVKVRENEYERKPASKAQNRNAAISQRFVLHERIVVDLTAAPSSQPFDKAYQSALVHSRYPFFVVFVLVSLFLLSHKKSLSLVVSCLFLPFRTNFAAKRVYNTPDLTAQ